MNCTLAQLPIAKWNLVHISSIPSVRWSSTVTQITDYHAISVVITHEQCFFPTTTKCSYHTSYFQIFYNCLLRFLNDDRRINLDSTLVSIPYNLGKA